MTQRPRLGALWFALFAVFGLWMGVQPVRNEDRPTSIGVLAQEKMWYLPIVQSRGSSLVGSGGRVTGMEGFGNSTIDLRNWSETTQLLRLRLRPAYESDIRLQRSVAAGLGDRISLPSEAQVRRGRYAAVISAPGPLGMLARTEWSSGAAAAYEACETGTNLILPLVARNVYSHTSIIYIQNTDESGQNNKIDFQMFDNSSGELMVSFTAYLDSGETISYDTWFDDLTFGDMPINAGEGGSLLALRMVAQRPVAVMAFGDEMAGDGTSAFVARPVSRAASRQFLPSVRANYLGNSLIGIANPSLTDPVAVTLSYRAHGTGLGSSTVRQEITIPARGASFIDLGKLRRGLPPPPGLPVGNRPNQGFLGQAIVEADRPILAVVQDEVRSSDKVYSVAAYNGFGPDDLGEVFSVPRIRVAESGRKTVLSLANPNLTPLEVVLAYRDVSGRALQSTRLSLEAGASTTVQPPTGLPEECQLDLVSSAPLAVLVCETTLVRPADWGRWGGDAMCYWPVRQPKSLPATPQATATPTATSLATATATTALSPSPTLEPRLTTVAPPTASSTPVKDLAWRLVLPYGQRN